MTYIYEQNRGELKCHEQLFQKIKLNLGEKQVVDF